MVWQSSTNEDTAFPWWYDEGTPLSRTCYLKTNFCSFSIRKLKVSCDIHMWFRIHYLRPRFLRSRFPRSLQGDLKHIIIAFLFQPYRQWVCVYVHARFWQVRFALANDRIMCQVSFRGFPGTKRPTAQTPPCYIHCMLAFLPLNSRSCQGTNDTHIYSKTKFLLFANHES